MRRIILAAVIVLSLCSCKESAQITRSFPYISVPAMVQDQNEAANYLARHFWRDYFNDSEEFISDTTNIIGVPREQFTEAFGQYAIILDAAEISSGKAAQDTLIKKTLEAMSTNPDSKLFDILCELEKHYFFDPNSPYRNEDYYLPVLNAIASSEFSNEADKRDAQYFLPLLNLNCIGTKANDFNYTLRNGRTGNLYKIDSDYTIILFSNPGCNDCKNIIEQIKASSVLNQYISNKIVTILNIYPDEDLSYWYDYLPNYPEEWISGYDAEQVLNLNTIYSLRAIPSLYLLDKEKNVILKDAPIEKILWFFERM